MAISVGVAVVLTVYVFMMGFTFWFCVIADPDKSPTARLVSHTLPTEFMKLAGKVVGPKGVKIIEIFMERLLAIIYLTVVCGGFALLHMYAYPWARESDHVPNYHLNIGYGVLLMALGTWRWTMTTSPGIITSETVQFYNHFPYDDLLYVEGRKDHKKGVPRLPRSKFDRLKHNEHVARFDHYCGWVAGTIGEENYRIFLFFVFTQFAMCCYGSYLLTKLFLGEIQDRNLFSVVFFDKASGQEYPANKWIVFQYLFHRHLYEAGILAIMAVMAVALFFFLGYHFYITSLGMTTNEQYKWGQVKQWHKDQVKKYEEYKKQQQEKQQQQQQEEQVENGSKEQVQKEDQHETNKNDDNGKQQQPPKPPVPDGDVTCTGGSEKAHQPAGDQQTTASASATASAPAPAPAPVAQQQEPPVMEDPGPMPRNIYNRGFIENWKEVLFPISLRRKAEAAKAARTAAATTSNKKAKAD